MAWELSFPIRSSRNATWTCLACRRFVAADIKRSDAQKSAVIRGPWRTMTTGDTIAVCQNQNCWAGQSGEWLFSTLAGSAWLYEQAPVSPRSHEATKKANTQHRICRFYWKLRGFVASCLRAFVVKFLLSQNHQCAVPEDDERARRCSPDCPAVYISMSNDAGWPWKPERAKMFPASGPAHLPRSGYRPGYPTPPPCPTAACPWCRCDPVGQSQCPRFP